MQHLVIAQYAAIIGHSDIEGAGVVKLAAKCFDVWEFSTYDYVQCHDIPRFHPSSLDSEFVKHGSFLICDLRGVRMVSRVRLVSHVCRLCVPPAQCNY